MIDLPIVDYYRTLTPNSTCSYLATESASFDFRIVTDLTAAKYDHLLARGWRRHGLHLFRPKCQACSKCRSLRVDVELFSPTKSQRRAVRRNERVRCVLRRPSVTKDHIDLYNRYHASMARRRGWPDRQTSTSDYINSYLAGRFEFEYETLYMLDDRLVGVGLVDITSQFMSSVYFFHDPDWRDDGPGTFSIIAELNYARNQGIKFFYLGYWIQECQSMAYKNRFQPYELLERFVDDDESPMWR